MARADRGGIGQGTGYAALNDRDTIVALSSGGLPAAIAILRISGGHARDAVTRIAGSLPPARRASVRALRRDDGELLDRALIVLFPGPASATGEDLIEVHCHGSRAVVAAVEQALLVHPNVRAAEPGEFTRRALLNGRIDFSQAQGLADLLAAETEAERRLAMRTAEGAVRSLIEGWMQRLTAIAAEIEASIDFGEEGDVQAEAASLASVDGARATLVADIQRALAAPPVERWRDGWRIVIAGPPNAGKSTLLNLLIGREAAIVSPIAGTTRDRIEAPVQRNGIGYVFTDTAGLRDATSDTVERIGIARAADAMASADMVIWLGDDPPPAGPLTVRVHGRADLPGRQVVPPGAHLAISRDDPASIDALWQHIESQTAGWLAIDQPALRQVDRSVVANVVERLSGGGDDLLLLAEVVRAARRELGTILGIDATESLLDQLFSRFCLGK